MATKIVTKNSSTASAAPTASDLVQGELAVNVTDKRLYTENASGAIVELGTNPSTIDINAGTIDGAVIGGATPAAITGTAITATGIMTATGTSVFASLDISGDIDVDGTTNLDVVDIDGAVDMASTLAVGGILTTSVNVGIGTSTTDPYSLGATGRTLAMDSSNDSTGSLISLRTNGTNRGYLFANSANMVLSAVDTGISLNFNTSDTERMRLDSSGNLLVGTTIHRNFSGGTTEITVGTTTTGATAGGAVTFGSGSGFLGYLGFQESEGTLGTVTSVPLVFKTGNAERMRIDSSGNLMVGKSGGVAQIGFLAKPDGEVYSTIANGFNTYHVYANSGYRFYVNPNGGLYNYSANNVNLSDEREKKNIEPLESQWDSLKQWSLKKFHYNADADSDNKKLGVIAQEVEAHNPEVISEFNVDETTTRMAVKEQQMMWMAIKALQEAQTRIETLEARVTELENN